MITATPLQTLVLEFTILEFHQDYVVSTLYEDEIFEKRHVEEITLLCQDFYKERRFVYVSHRKNNYNVDPTIYLALSKVKFLRGIAVVSENLASINMAYFEKRFVKLPFEIFLNWDDALNWVGELLKIKKADL